jgi:uncharacterized protein (DUF362 family)
VVGAGLLLPAGALWRVDPLLAEAAESGAEPPDIVLAKGGARVATQKALAALGGMQRFVKPDQVVVVKPNAGFATPPDLGATTHPDVVTAILDACFEAGARRVLVVDHTLRPAEQCFERTGLAAAVAAFPKAKLVSLDDEKAYQQIEVPKGKALHTVQIPVLLQKADVFINVPTAKSHSATMVSLGLKNLMGLVWDRNTFHVDIDLHQGIADLATVLKPDLTIVDAVRILKTGGPDGPGDVDPFDGVVAGVDPIAVDAYAVGLSTWNRQTLSPEQVSYIRHAARHGLGSLDLKTLRIVELG